MHFPAFCSGNIEILLYYRIAIKQQVNINRSVDIRPAHTLTTPPQFTFGRLRNTENLFRRLLCTQYCHGIQKRVVRAEPPRFRFIKSGQAFQSAYPLNQYLYSPVQQPFTIAQIAAQT